VDLLSRNALRGLATAEKHHADLWAIRIQQLGATLPEYSGPPGDLLRFFHASRWLS